MQEENPVPDRSESEAPQSDNGLLEEATDWLLRLRAAPEDRSLHADFTLWLTEAEDHGRAFARAERVWRLGGELSPRFEETWAAPEATENVSNVSVLKPRARRAVRRPVLAAAIAASIALLVLLVGPRTELMFLDADLTSGTAEIARYDLADGSHVTLNAGSALKTNLTASERAVTILDGEAFFEVHPDPERPFRVRAGDTIVTVTGTEFGTRLSDRTVMVEVEGGTVSVSSGTSELIQLKRGDRLKSASVTDETVTMRVPASHIAAWRRGLLIADNERIDSVVERIRPYYSGAIFIAPGGLAGKRVSGVFDLGNPVEALRAAVLPHDAGVYEIPAVLAVLGPG
ncbi:FecR domain-containing protein [Nisaea acidiphila]|uniref:FecR domain-containing protein n=1 Tax=Nisaea acidiphila TaxID=1862145 RepID=A0A9J7APF0_9PROT|nr:FecR domain-containing protein [Nisaea acidiphila]UUX49288.1 FecR domain-containing protein [Nisaea acidiphila]